MYRNLVAAVAIVFTSAVSGSGTSAMAQRRESVPEAEKLLVEMRNALDRMGAAEFEFSFRAENMAGDVLGEESGSFVAEGECFRMTASLLTVYCDGRTKWIYDMNNEEIAIFPHDAESADPAENPFAVLRKADPSEYNMKGQVRTVVHDGHPAYLFRMSSRDVNAAYTFIDFTVSADNCLPVAVTYESRNGDRYRLEILAVRERQHVSKDFFAPPADLLDDPDVLVTDMR